MSYPACYQRQHPHHQCHAVPSMLPETAPSSPVPCRTRHATRDSTVITSTMSYPACYQRQCPHHQCHAVPGMLPETVPSSPVPRRTRHATRDSTLITGTICCIQHVTMYSCWLHRLAGIAAPRIQNKERALDRLCNITQYNAYRRFQYLYCSIVYGSLQSHAQTPFGKTESRDQ